MSNIIKQYQNGLSTTEHPFYEGLLLFLVGLLQTWHGLSNYELEDDDQKPEQPKPPTLVRKQKPGVDPDGRWIKKAGKLRFGYKQHTATDEQGPVQAVITTGANENDVKHMNCVLAGADLPAKGYMSKDNDAAVTMRKLRNHLMNKVAKNRPLTQREQECNKLISKVWHQVERTFGSIRCWFGGETARYVGLQKMYTKHLMEFMAYNRYRCSSRIAIYKNEKQDTPQHVA